MTSPDIDLFEDTDPDGRALLKCIVISDAEFDSYKTHKDFIRRHIFPSGGLPSITVMTRALSSDELAPHGPRGPCTPRRAYHELVAPTPRRERRPGTRTWFRRRVELFRRDAP
jgi:hypothetical protein